MTSESASPGRGAPVVSLLTDYGVRDEFVGVCHAILVYEDPYRSLGVAINRGDAASTMRITEDSRLTLRRR